MEGEEEKSGAVKKRDKTVEIGFDSDDDEPIGTLLKLKKPRKAKKARLGLEADSDKGNKVEATKEKSVAVDDDDSGGMDDTLACFRRKLKGPKKDGGLKVSRERSVSSAEVDQSKQSSSLKDASVDETSAENVVEMGHNAVDHGSDKKADKKKQGKASKCKLEKVKKLSYDVSESRDNSVHLESQEIARSGSKDSADEPVEDSLSSFFKKAQAGGVSKFQKALGSKSKKGKIIKKASSNGGSSQGDEERSHSATFRKMSGCSFSVKVASQNHAKESPNRRSVSAPKECFQVENRSSDDNTCCAPSFIEETHNVAKGLVSAQEVNPPEPFDAEKPCSGDVELMSTQGNEISLAAEVMVEAESGKTETNRVSTDAVSEDKADVSMSRLGDEVQDCCFDNKLLDNSCTDAAEDVCRSCNGRNSEVPVKTVEDVLVTGGLQNDTWRRSTTPVDDDITMDEILDENENSLPESGSKENRLSVAQRRKAKKYRQEDMAYEGDAEWDTLISEHGFLESYQLMDSDRPHRSRGKVDSSVNGSAAAVSVGLKARAAGPVEKIKFKEVFKRKGGLQEYLECRNWILSLWSKDMSRILSLADCSVSDIPLEDESPRSSLLREIYAFLDQNGYINVGVACAKQNAELVGPQDGEQIEKPGGMLFVDSELGIGSNINNGMTSDAALIDENHKSEITECLPRKLESPNATNGKNYQGSDKLDIDSTDTKLPSRSVKMDDFADYPTPMLVESREDMAVTTEVKGDSHLTVSTLCIPAEGESDEKHGHDFGKRIIVIGAGPAGLTAARHLKRQGFSVTVLEARSRIGGRVYTDRSSLSVPVDLGASIITGVEADVASERRPDPSSLVCTQLGIELTVLNSDCPLYDIVTGQKVPSDLDEALEAEYNGLLDDMVLVVAQNGERAMKMSLEDGLEYALKRRRMARIGTDTGEAELRDSLPAPDNSKTSIDNGVTENSCVIEEDILSPLERRVMNWHFAHLEYGCAALLKEVSLPYWNQDDVFGGFGGAHCMIKGGFSAVVESLGKGLDILLDHVVTEISYSSKDSEATDDHLSQVKVCTSNGREFLGDAVLITVPLGCLKAESIKFLPPLPHWKQSSIKRLGFGVLNKIVLEFPEVFWDDSVDYFGATAEETDHRGQCFMFWNIKKTVGAPVLIALLVGKAAKDGEHMSPQDHADHAVMVLRKLFGEASVPNPVGSVVTDWGRDPFSYGAYSYVAIGASGEDYDIIGKPVENCIFFAGEATCKEHPDTVGGAMMSGLREAVRIMDILSTGNDYRTEVEALEAAQRQSDGERDEVRDIMKRLDAVELSNYLYKNSLEGEQILSKEALLRELFFSAKATSGRLRVAKALLNLPVEALKTFAGTKEGLSTLNSWILDSMGKDATQLLRHCVRLLVRVSTDLRAIRLSGIGKTVKEKVCVHTSRDIRAIASQLVNVWLEVFRKEKASNGKLNVVRQNTALDSLKIRPIREPFSGKAALRAQHGGSDNKGNSHTSVSSGSQAASSGNKKVKGRPTKLETINDSKSESDSSRSRGSVRRHDLKVEEDESIPMSEEEKAAFAAAEEARAKAIAAAEAFASAEANYSAMMHLPKIPSFHKFARREQYAQWPGGVLGRQDCLSEIDSRNCRVRDWSVDFPAAFGNLDIARVSLDNRSHRSHSNEVAGQPNLAENSGESVAVDSSIFTKAWVDASGSESGKDYHAIERWQSQAAAAGSDFFNSNEHMMDEGDSNMISRPAATWRNDGIANESSVSPGTVNKGPKDNQLRGPDKIKQAVVDYVASLLMPLYKARKIDRDGYKSIMKKTATKVMEQAADAEKAMAVYQFLDYKRKNKIRAFVDTLIERHMAAKAAGKP
ncbi:hypothetical protein CDL15_Pgr021357 [Punica granatum]|uniref:SWIRM domain-containing protein n=1 Tax=Punica granatum TaxID=22663 RepID=A0A218WQU6_PUNGR|nr:hypothetical protein CDL15_Pgr021357 [Punica granatum]